MAKSDERAAPVVRPTISPIGLAPARKARGSRETLPKGFWRAPSKSLRVQVRVTGCDPVVKSFPLFKDTTEERQKQLLEATEWAARTRSNLLGGVFVSTREAESLTLGDALVALRASGLKGKPGNVAKDINRIDQILGDEISRRPLASLQTADLARYRDKLSDDFWQQQVERRIASLEGKIGAAEKSEKPSLRSRIASLQELRRLKRALSGVMSGEERDDMRQRVRVIEAAEGITGPARTTLSNKLQIVSRALKHIRQTVNGVPSLDSVTLPPASPGRARRVSDQELQTLLGVAADFDARLPLLIRFAIETALRRERVLDFRVDYVTSIGRGQRAILFPKSSERQKRTGIIPVTREIDDIIQSAVKVGGIADQSEKPVFGINPLTLDTWWKRLLDKCGIKDLHFHDLRHEATSRLFERGLSTVEVMSITGHSTTEMVDRYSHYSAGLVLAKLEKGNDPKALFDEIDFLTRQYLAAGGDRAGLQRLLESTAG